MNANKKMHPRDELIGKCIRVRWPGHGGVHKALVVGFQNWGPENRIHKLYYLTDESTEVLDLSKLDWEVMQQGTEPWDKNGLVGKRLVVYRNIEGLNHVQKEKAGESNKKVTKVPYEAFVVHFISDYKYRLLYTHDDSFDTRDLLIDHQAWDLLEPGVFKIGKKTVASWSCKIDTEEDENTYI